MVALLVLAAWTESDGPDWSALARGDLARRLGLRTEEVRVVQSKPVTWPDGSLGLARPGEMATMALVPGAVLTVEAKGRTFRYHAGGNAVKLAGPVALERFSLLFLETNDQDANGNGSLVRSSVLGHGAQTLLANVSEFEPGPGPAVLCVRRTSRSAHELWLWNSKAPQNPRRVHTAFSYGPLAADGKTGRWAAVFRSGAGLPPHVVLGDSRGNDARSVEPPPGSSVDRLAFESSLLVARTGREWWGLGREGWVPTAHLEAYDERGRWLVNRSATLVARTERDVEGRPRTVVAKVRGSGAETSRAILPGLEFQRFEPLADGWVLVCGREVEGYASYLVQADLGWVIPSLQAGRPVRALDWPAEPPRFLPGASLDSGRG